MDFIIGLIQREDEFSVLIKVQWKSYFLLANGECKLRVLQYKWLEKRLSEYRGEL